MNVYEERDRLRLLLRLADAKLRRVRAERDETRELVRRSMRQTDEAQALTRSVLRQRDELLAELKRLRALRMGEGYGGRGN